MNLNYTSESDLKKKLLFATTGHFSSSYFRLLPYFHANNANLHFWIKIFERNAVCEKLNKYFSTVAATLAHHKPTRVQI